MELLERSGELAEPTRALEAARPGAGSVVLVGAAPAVLVVEDAHWPTRRRSTCSTSSVDASHACGR
jgi:hypothetical protein